MTAPVMRHGRSWRADDGAATVWALAAGLLTILVALTAAAVGSAVVTRHRAQSAADLAALAGALRVVEGEAVACTRADRIAAAQGARLVGCQIDGWDVVVTVEASPAGAAGLIGKARASARAGPADSPESEFASESASDASAAASPRFGIVENHPKLQWW